MMYHLCSVHGNQEGGDGCPECTVQKRKDALNVMIEEVMDARTRRRVRLLGGYPADANGWIQWDGGDCPVPDETLVNLKVREESKKTYRDYACNASFLSWKHSNSAHDVVAYRVVRETTEEPGAIFHRTPATPPIERTIQAKADIDATLADPDKRYGSFVSHAEITQKIKRAMSSNTKWDALRDEQKEALEMVAHYVGRIINGDPDYIDSWLDIGVYSTLIVRRLEKEQNNTTNNRGK